MLFIHYSLINVVFRLENLLGLYLDKMADFLTSKNMYYLRKFKLNEY